MTQTFKVDLAFFRRDCEEISDLTWTKGTLTVGPEGTRLEFPAHLSPDLLWMIEVRRGEGSVDEPVAPSAGDLVPV